MVKLAAKGKALTGKEAKAAAAAQKVREAKAAKSVKTKNDKATKAEKAKKKAAADKKVAEAKAKKSAMNKLAPMAKEINVRLEKADKAEDNAYDHRLSAALKLDEAKTFCKENKVRFPSWCEKNVKQSYETVRKLVRVGGAENPQLALDDLRGKNKEANQKLRDAKKSEPKKVSRDTTTGMTPDVMVNAGFEAMGDQDAMDMLHKQASALGVAVKEVEEVTKMAKTRSTLLADLKVDFKSLKLADQNKFVKWASEYIGLVGV